jgi:hypothetical protein
MKGRVVLLDAQPKVLLRLSSYAIHPLVIFLRPASNVSIKAMLDPGNATPDRVDYISDLSFSMENEFSHIFDHVVDCGSSISDNVQSVAKILSQHLFEGYWFESTQELPLGPPHVSRGTTTPSADSATTFESLSAPTASIAPSSSLIHTAPLTSAKLSPPRVTSTVQLPTPPQLPPPPATQLHPVPQLAPTNIAPTNVPASSVSSKAPSSSQDSEARSSAVRFAVDTTCDDDDVQLDDGEKFFKSENVRNMTHFCH